MSDIDLDALEMEVPRWPTNWAPIIDMDEGWTGEWACEGRDGPDKISADYCEDYAEDFAKFVAQLANAAPLLIARIRELEARRDIDSEIIDDLRLRHTQAVTARDAYAEQLLAATKHAVELEQEVAEARGGHK